MEKKNTYRSYTVEQQTTFKLTKYSFALLNVESWAADPTITRDKAAVVPLHKPSNKSTKLFFYQLRALAFSKSLLALLIETQNDITGIKMFTGLAHLWLLRGVWQKNNVHKF